MKIKDFVDKYKNMENLPVDMLSKKYVGYALKVGSCINIVDNCNTKKTKDVITYYKNSAAQNMMFKCELIKNYTDINFDGISDLEAYDMLSESGLMNKIIEIIPEDEYIEWNCVLNYISDDFYENSRSLVSFLENKINEFNSISSVIGDNLNSLIENNN